METREKTGIIQIHLLFIIKVLQGNYNYLNVNFLINPIKNATNYHKLSIYSPNFTRQTGLGEELEGLFLRTACCPAGMYGMIGQTGYNGYQEIGDDSIEKRTDTCCSGSRHGKPVWRLETDGSGRPGGAHDPGFLGL